MMINKKKGVFLIYVIISAVLISIFLLTAVSDLHNSFFITQRFTGENRAYWAAESGIQYCKYKLKSDLGWPFFNAKKDDNNKEGTEQFGKFTVTTSKRDGGKGYYIHGTSNNGDQFCIYFSKREDSVIGSDDISIVPTTFPNDPKNLSYCSYTSMKESDINNSVTGSSVTGGQKFSNFAENIENEKVDEKTFIVSKSPITYKTVIISPNIYIVSDGRFGAYRSVVETMFIADNGNGFNSGIYAGGNIDLLLSGKDSVFKVSNDSNGKAEIYCKGEINIKRNDSAENELNYSFPASIGNGEIYYGKSFNIIDQTDKGETLTTKRMTSNDFKRKYGLNLEEYPSSKDDQFPKIRWSNVEKIREKQESQKDKDGNKIVEEIKSGSYVAIFEEENNGYTLCRLNKNYMLRDGQFAEDEYKKDLETAKNNRELEKQRIIEKYTDYQKDEHGNIIDSVFNPPGPELLAKKSTDRGLIEEFLKHINGLKTDEEANNDILSSNKKEEREKSNIFSIDTVEIKDKLTPIITLKKSAITLPVQNPSNLEDTEYFNLFTLTKNNNNKEFDIDQTTSTDLIFKDKTNGVSEKELLLLANSQNEEDDEDSLIPNDNTTMLYTKGYVSINGKLSGTGQILSSGSIYFKAGSQLNTAKTYTSYVPTNQQFGPPVMKQNVSIPSSKNSLYLKDTISIQTRK